MARTDGMAWGARFPGLRQNGPMPQSRSPQEYVVGLDHTVVLAARRRMLAAVRASAWAGTIGGALILLLAAGLAGFLGGSALLVASFIAVPGVILLVSERRQFARLRELRATWNAHRIPDVAMRMSPQGLTLSIDVAAEHVFLPWAAVAGFQVRPYRGKRMLMLDLAPGVGPRSPGVEGLDHPDVQRVLTQEVLGLRGIRFAEETLTRPISDIDQAAAYLTQGRVRVH